MDQKGRRISDELLSVFNRACDDGLLQLAEHLMRAVEIALTEEGGAGQSDRRESVGYIAAAYARLAKLRGQAPPATRS